MTFENKNIVVTGASRGIGKSIADALLRGGANVWGVATKECEAFDSFTAAFNGRFHPLYANAADTAQFTSVIDSAVAESGGFDGAVNNAGITRDGLSMRMKQNDWDDVLAVNLTAAFVLCRSVLPGMIKKRGGSIVNMTSIVGLHGQGGQANYAASKAGLIGLTKSLAKEVGGRGIRVNAVAPGFIKTDMTDALPQAAAESLLDSIPLKRSGTPGNIADAVLFLLSDMSSYITGQVLGVDGGMGC